MCRGVLVYGLARPCLLPGGDHPLRQTETQLANLKPDDALAHGVYTRDGVLTRCDRCPVAGTCEDRTEAGLCELERCYVEQRRAQLHALPWIAPAPDGPALSILLWQEVRITRAARYLLGAKGPGNEG